MKKPIKRKVTKRKPTKTKAPHIVKLVTHDKKIIPAVMPGAYLKYLTDKPITKVEVVGPWETAWRKFVKYFD